MEKLRLRNFLRDQGFVVQQIKLSSGTIDPNYDFTEYSEVNGISVGQGSIKMRPIYQRHPKMDRCDYYLCVNNTANGGKELTLFKSPDWKELTNDEEANDINRWESWE